MVAIPTSTPHHHWAGRQVHFYNESENCLEIYKKGTEKEEEVEEEEGGKTEKKELEEGVVEEKQQQEAWPFKQHYL